MYAHKVNLPDTETHGSQMQPGVQNMAGDAVVRSLLANTM